MNYNDKIRFFYVLSIIEVKEIGVGSLIWFFSILCTEYVIKIV